MYPLSQEPCHFYQCHRQVCEQDKHIHIVAVRFCQAHSHEVNQYLINYRSLKANGL